MALFSSRGVLLHVTNDCYVCALLVVTSRDSFRVECREHGWEWRGQFVFSTRVLYGAWAAWAIKALAPTLNKKNRKNKISGLISRDSEKSS